MKAREHGVRRLFSRIATQYDLLNSIISFGLHKPWRRRTLQLLDARLEGPNGEGAPSGPPLCLDVAAGTCDFAIALHRRGIRTIALDMTPPMLEMGRRRQSDLPIVVADAFAMPFPDATFDYMTAGFGFRHAKEDLPLLLGEMRRVLKPGGRCVSLELSHPPNRLWDRLSSLYIHAILPIIGGFVDRPAYEYLSDSLHGYPDAPGLASTFLQAGFDHCDYHLLAGSVAAIHVATVAPADARTP